MTTREATYKRYYIPTQQKLLKLLLKGDGDLKGSSIGHKNLEFIFIEIKKKTSILRIVLISNLLNRVNRSLK
ncbi:Csa1 family protein [Staphylococcus aureus]